MDDKSRAVHIFSKIGYILGCGILYLLSLWIIGSAVYSIVLDVLNGGFTVYNLLDEVGLIVFSIAVIDVAKYLTLEEIIKHSHIRKPREEREILTKFVVIIATALALEGLVLTIEVAKTQLDQLVYPVLLLLTSTVFIIGVGVYQKLNASVDKS